MTNIVNIFDYVFSKKSVSLRTIFNVIYTPSEDVRLGFNYQVSLSPTYSIDIRAYDITELEVSEIDIPKDFIDHGYSYYALNAEEAGKAEVADNLSFPVPLKNKAFTNWTGWFTSLDFFNYTLETKLLFIIKGTSYAGIDTNPIGFLNASSSWAGRFPYTGTFADGGGYVICTPPSTANPQNSPQLVGNNTGSVNVNVRIYDVTGIDYTEDEIKMIADFDDVKISALEMTDYIMHNVDMSDNLKSDWKGKNILFIGDSLTEANKYQLKNWTPAWCFSRCRCRRT